MRFATLSALIAIVLSISANVSAEDVVPWQSNLNEAMEVARKENRPLLLHFWSPDCGPCLQLDDNVFSKASVAETLSDFFVPVKINGAAAPAVRAAYRVDRYPTDVIVLPNNEVVHRMITPQNPEQYIHQLTAVAFRTGLVAKQQSKDFVDRYAEENGESEAADPLSVPAQPDNRFDEYRNQFGKYVDDQVVPAQAQSNEFTNGSNRQREVMNPYATGATTETPPRQDEQRQDDRRQYGESGYAKERSFDREYQPSANAQGLATTDRQSTLPQHSGGFDRQTASPNADLYASEGQYNTRTEKNATRTQPQSPTASLDGYCPVTLLTKEQWKKGSPALGAIHRGRLFLFTGDKEKKMFLANPDKFSPVLAGVDPVELTERGEVLEGKRAHGVVYRSQVFLFVNEANLEKFWGSPESYTATILQAMQSSGDGTMYR